MLYLVTHFPTSGEITNITPIERIGDGTEASARELYAEEIRRGVCSVMSDADLDRELGPDEDR